MSIIKISNLTFRYERSNTKLFEHLNLNLDSTWRLGLVGRNGRGKTTFLNLLQGKLHGTGKIQANLNLTYYPVTISDPSNLTLYELQSQVSFEQWELERELNLMNVDPDLLWQPFNTLSGGEQTKILLALAFADQTSLALLDEPTNHLDENSRQTIIHYLRQHKNGYIVVSHDREFLNQVTDHILAIENTAIHLYHGNFATYEDTKEKRDAVNREHNRLLKNEIKALNQSRLQLKNYSYQGERQKTAQGHRNEDHANIDKGFYSHKAAKVMQRSKNVERRMNQNLQEKQGLMTNIETIPELTMHFQPNYRDVLLTIQHLTLTIDQRPLFNDLNLMVKNHGVVALTGHNGAGKSTLLKVLLNQAVNVHCQGNITMANDLKISYLPQNFVKYHGTLHAFADQHQISDETLLNTLKKLGVPRSAFNIPIEEMSMGMQKRVALAKSLTEPADLYLWDEPANYLDVFNQDQLIKLLQQTHPAMLLIEHDRYFIDQVTSQCITIDAKK